MIHPHVRLAGALLLVGLAVASPVAQIPLARADVDGDCTVTNADVNLVKANLGRSAPNLPVPRADVNADGRVNTTDLNFVMRNVGKVVCSLNRPPVAAAGSDQRALVSQPVSLDGRGSSDPDGDALTYAWEIVARPAGSTVPLSGAGTVAPSFVPDQPGDYDVRLTVQDGRGGSASDIVRVTADRMNRPPTITTSPGLEAQVGQPYVYDVDATDPDNDSLTYALVFGPAGMAIDASTGAITWTPTLQQVGIRGGQVSVTDPDGATAYQGLAIQVLAPANGAPTAAADSYEARLGQTLVVASPGLLANDSDPDGQALTAQLVSPPGEGTLDLRADGGFTYTPRALAAPGALNPAVEWTQSTFRVGRTSTQIMMTPIVIDADRDGAPEIFVTTHTGSSWGAVGYLRALAGRPTWRTNFNLAHLRGATIQASSTFSGNYVPERAIDGDPQTSWFTTRTDAAAWFQVTFPSAATVRELRMLGNRQFPTGHDFLSGRFQLFDAAGAVRYDSGIVTLPAPNRDVTLVLPAPVDGVTRARFSATGYETVNDDHGFAELEIIGDGMAGAGTELWSVGGQAHGSGGIAAGDIDLDGFAELVVQDGNGGLVAFEHDGTFKWRSPDLGFSGGVVASPSIADMDGDGTPEIIAGASVVNSDGTLRWLASTTDTGDNGYGPLSSVVDLDLDGRPEVLTGRSAYRADGSVYWTSSRREAFTGVGNFDLDPFPEIVSVDRSGVWLHEHNGVLKWGPRALPEGGRGGPPTVADVDADGEPEIGVAGSDRYVVFETDGSIKWAIQIQDFSSNVTGSSVFDFEGDGSAEIVYGDELYLRILRGVDGAELFRMPKGSSTLHELPTVADIDGDGQAEIVVGANDADYGNETGLYVIGGADGNWMPTRAIWNQHTYHVTNVRADGSIPATETHHWLVPGLNMFRQNAFGPGDPDRVTSFTYRVSDGSLSSGDAQVQITLRQPNSAPAILTQPTAAAAAGITYVYGPAVVDPDLGDTHTFDLLLRPAGMTIDAVTGLVRWTPGEAQRGDHAVTLRVVDRGGLSALQSFTVTVGSPIAVPIVTGRSQAQAEDAARAAGLSVGAVTSAYSLTVPAGHVIAQLPLAGTLVAPLTAVNLEVSAGLEPVAVPNLTGLTTAAATSLLTSRGLVLGTVALASSNTAAPGTVMLQSPGAGVVVGVTSTVDVTVSTGAALTLTIARGLVDAGGSTTFVVQAYDNTGTPLPSPPPMTLAVTSAPGESAGTSPSIAGDVITTSGDTRGVYLLRATIDGTSHTASASFVVSRAGRALTPYATLSDAMGAMTQNVAALEQAILSGDLAAVPALREALLATRDSLPLDTLAVSTAFAPEGGFAPTLAALTAAGFPETPADIAWNTALRNLIATVEQTEGFVAQLRQSGPQNDDATLQQLNVTLEARVGALLAIRPTVHGIVKHAHVANQLVSIRLPRLLHAQVEVVARTLAEQGLARRADGVTPFYAGLAATPAGSLDPAAYYAQRQPTMFSLVSLMSATRIRSTIIKDVYMPLIGELTRGALILAGNDLLQTYTNAGSLVGVITASSLSFHFFEVPGSVIEGFGFDRDFREGNEVFIVGPGTISQVQSLFSGIQPFADAQEAMEFFDGVREQAQALGEQYFSPDNRFPGGIARGCIFEFHPACNQLVYDSGFYSVHETGAGSFPAPVLFIVRNVVTGSWGTFVANFFPTRPD